MHKQDRPPAVAYLAGHCERAAAAHEALRAAVLESGPLDRRTCELIVLGGFVAMRAASSFKSHARRLLEGGTTREVLRQAVLVNFGSTATFPAIVEALRWIDELTEPSSR
jgi:alkylhydroperoxidase/carboxymuconolactone decarboxylase family protein YurZ